MRNLQNLLPTFDVLAFDMLTSNNQILNLRINKVNKSMLCLISTAWVCGRNNTNNVF